MKILVTGANGYMGQGIVKCLLDDGQEVIATDFYLNQVDKRAVQIAADIFEIDEPYTFFNQPDVVLHLAWRDGFKHSSYNHIEDLPKHYHFLRKMIESGIKRVCVLGSMHEVGFYEGSIDESTPTNPLSLYGISKDALRNMVKLLCSENNTCYQWIRGYYIVGNVASGCSVFSKIAECAAAGKTEFPFTMGQNQFDFLDYEEFCMQVAAVVEQDEVNGVINCCSGHPMKLRDRVEQFIEENHYEIKLQYGAFPDRPYDSKAVWGNNEKIVRIMKSYNM